MSAPDGAHAAAHRRTLEVYERGASDWRDRRAASTDEAVGFAASLGPEDRPVVDLGAGPGWHSGALGPGTIALDAAAAMLALTGEHAPGARRVRADLAALPFARGSLGAAWASKSYVHLARTELPMAWWDLHRALRPGAPVHLRVFAGDDELSTYEHDDFAGRSFSGWPPELLDHVLVGAGFEVVERGEGDEGRAPLRDGDALVRRLRRRRTLADTVGPDLRLLLVGLNPSLRAADAGVGFVTPGNRAWPALLSAGLATRDRDPLDLLHRHRIGMTDLVKRATARADELDPSEYRGGLARLEALCAWLRPAAVCIVGLSGWRVAVDRRAVAGVQERRLGGRPVYLMPNPSGLNAHVTVDSLADHLRAAAQLADEGAQPADKGAQLADEAAQLADEGAQPADEGAQPADEGARLADGPADE